MTRPRRVQRRRTRGWRTPTCSCGCGQPARYVGRPSRWGSPYEIVRRPGGVWQVWDGLVCSWRTPVCQAPTRAQAQEQAVRHYTRWLSHQPALLEDARTHLAGHDLACWCPLGTPCHADVLLTVLNRGPA